MTATSTPARPTTAHGVPETARGSRQDGARFRSCAHLQSPASIAKRVATMRKRWADPEQKRALIEKCGFQSEKARKSRALAMQRPEVRAKAALSVFKPSYVIARALHPPKFRPESIAKYVHLCKTRPKTDAERAKKEATRAVSMAARRAHQARILADMAVPRDCRDVARVREILASGVYILDLSLWLGLHTDTIRAWLRGAAVPRVVR